MLLLFSILFGIVILLLLILFVPMLLGVDFLHEGVPKLKIRFRLLSIPFSIRIPLENKSKKKDQVFEKKDPLSPKEFIKKAEDLYHGYREAEHELKVVLQEIRKKISCKDFNFLIRYGTKNPATTGMLNPMIWTAGTLIIKVLDSLIGVKKKSFHVYPDFQNVSMCLHIKGTFSFKLFDAIRFTMSFIRLVNIIKSYMSTEKNEKDGVLNGRTSY